ncbi:MAG: helix-turn-helix domain-containing protein [Ruminococcaceae bacterium]|nr:helix-turn-helix domain-containing protein [Oscillospiraceae bacterium]MBE6984887.1 helix-turn-helix domain-containing protein [Oscillospiraceae bacterium]
METVIKREKLTLTIAEAAELVGVSTSKMYQLARIKGFPAIRVGKRVLVSAKKLPIWVEEQAEKGWYNYEV